jgi:hypothetical protein
MLAAREGFFPYKHVSAKTISFQFVSREQPTIRGSSHILAQIGGLGQQPPPIRDIARSCRGIFMSQRVSDFM